MTRSLWPPTLAALALAFAAAWLAEWLLNHTGWESHAASRVAYSLFNLAVPVIWIALVVASGARQARRVTMGGVAEPVAAAAQ